MIGIISVEEGEAEHNVKERKWIHEPWKIRENEREFATLYKELTDGETKFFQDFKMSKNCFNILLCKTVPPEEARYPLEQS